MKKITLGGMQASDIVLGCMRISDMAVSRVQELLETAVEAVSYTHLTLPTT